MTVLLVAASGGHLAELNHLAARIHGVDDDALWVTFDSPQSQSLLSGRRQIFIPYSGTRDALRVLRNTGIAARIIRDARPELVVSTGNSIALSFLPVARLMGLPAAYIESAARVDGPSVTGRILRRVPGVQLFSQSRHWAHEPWHYRGCVFDDFAPAEMTEERPIERVVVTLGMTPYGFRRLVERIIAILPEGCEVFWQIGDTDVDGLGIDASVSVPPRELHEKMRSADVVIAHSGIGSALAALQAGRCPVLVPRERAHGEHVDDHQREMGTVLDSLGLAVHKRADDLRLEDLVAAARLTIATRRDLTPLVVSSVATA